MFIYDTPPCKKCENRKVACHSTCEKYKNWKVEHNLKVEEIEKKEKTDKEIRSYKAQFYEKYMKKINWHKK